MVAPGSPSSKFKYLLRQQRLRYKGTFIAPDSAGRWVNWQTASPHDWRRSIRRESWLFEIAHTTRQVAEREQQSIAVMWFVENHPGATPHAVLPWFHNPSPLIGSIKAAPRRKYQDTTDFRLRTVADWERLQQNSADGKRIERVVVEPTDAELIRNRPFAEALGKLAASKRFVVELAGGILSHAYYVLRREGAQVECVDLVGLDEDVVEYNKIVRDRIPEIIERRGERAETIQLRDEALRTALRRKLVEEAFEALDAKSDEDLVSELADIKEVVAALRRALGVTNVQLESERKEKKRRRGGFAKGLMLTTTAVPHFAPQPGAEIGSLGLDSQPVDPIIFDSANLPVGRLNRRPDLRHIGRQLEKLFTFEVEANNLETLKQTFSFSMPLADQVEQDFSLTVELRRVRSSIRAAIRLRVEPSQMKMLFPNDAQLVIEFPEDSSDG
jgi:predicted house-cleaning noncanonical NTP pyrophosphatase (MazG superfamily)